MLSQRIRQGFGRFRRRRISIANLLLFGSSGLIVIAVGLVLGIAIWSGRENTVELTRERAELTIGLIRDGLSHRLDPIRVAATGLADLIGQEGIDPFRQDRWLELAAGTLTALPQISALRYVSIDGRVSRVSKSDSGGFRHRTYEERSPTMDRINAAVIEAKQPFWGDVFWGEAVGEPAVNLRAPVRQGDTVIGHVNALVSVASLSRLLLELTQNYESQAFILIDGTRVLAHPSLLFGLEDIGPDRPLPSIDEIGDPVLARIWDEGTFVDRLSSRSILAGRGHIISLGNELYAFIYKQVDDYGPRPWLIGTYIQEETVVAAFARLSRAGTAGLIILFIAAGLAWWTARRVASPVKALAAAAESVRALDFAGAVHLERSRIEELDDAALAFNAMFEGLRWFEAYVPKALVKRLVGRGADTPITSLEREVTVMFTDIAGFTALSERMGPGDVANFLNRHFTLLEACVDAEDGIVDKYLGDGMMAFWGAPDLQTDHALRACRTALAIAAALKADNAGRIMRGLSPVKVRIGIHSGMATVGNIGSEARLNYTIVGDTVNSAERLCELGKSIMGEGDEVIILMSGQTAIEAAAMFQLRQMGEIALRGRRGEIQVFQLKQ